MNFSDILSGVGYAADTPRRLVYQGLIDPVARGLGHTGDPIERFSDVLGTLGMDKDSMLTHALGFAGDVATDPLTWAGGALGAKAGKYLFGRMGPMHGSDVGKLAGLAIPEAEAGHAGVEVVNSLTKQAAMPGGVGDAARKVLNEIPAGSTYLGSGAEATALRTPQGDVLRLGRHHPNSAIGIPAVDDVLQPSRRVAHGRYEVTRAPMATNVGETPFSEAAEMAKRLQGQGVDFIDIHSGNIGKVGGRNRVIDYGAIDAPNLPFKDIHGDTPLPFLAGGVGGGAAAGGGVGSLARALGRRRPPLPEFPIED